MLTALSGLLQNTVKATSSLNTAIHYPLDSDSTPDKCRLNLVPGYAALGR